jgi:hypothetical protein
MVEISQEIYILIVEIYDLFIDKQIAKFFDLDQKINRLFSEFDRRVDLRFGLFARSIRKGCPLYKQ